MDLRAQDAEVGWHWRHCGCKLAGQMWQSFTAHPNEPMQVHGATAVVLLKLPCSVALLELQPTKEVDHRASAIAVWEAKELSAHADFGIALVIAQGTSAHPLPENID